MDKQKVHVVGIAGNGMCAVAEASLACGYVVTGSDRLWGTESQPAVLATLARAGCQVAPQDGSAITSSTTAVVISTAIEEDNPDIQSAHKQGVPVYHRAKWLASLIGSNPLLGVAGTSGKSTVTAMVGWILQQTGHDPFVINGASVAAWESAKHTGHVRLGAQDMWVLELDESDRSLLAFSPLHAVITNQSADHFTDVETKQLFQAFEQQVRGECVSGAWELSSFEGTLSGCQFFAKGVHYALPMIGRHNAQNAIAASVLASCVGVPFEAAAEALRSFPGVRRRLERCKGDRVHVFDDYSHNPAKITAALDAILPFARNLTVIWRPHGYGPLRKMMSQFEVAFGRLADSSAQVGHHHRLLLLPVYDMGGTATRDVQSGDLAERLRSTGLETHCLATYDEVVLYCNQKHVQEGDAVLVMGARDPSLTRLACEIAKEHEKRFA